MDDTKATPPASHDESSEEVSMGAGLDFSDPNSPLAPYFITPSQLLALVLVLAAFFWLNIVPLWHTDIWGHLLFGQKILSDLALPAQEPFSRFSDQQTTLVHFQWLAQVLYALTFQAGEWLAGGDPLRQLAGGAAALRFLHAVVGLIEWSFLLACCRRASGSLGMACLAIALLALARVGVGDIQRPQAFGTLFFSMLLFLLLEQPLTKRAVVMGALLFGLWANMHGSFLMGFFLIGIFGAARSWEMARLHGWSAFAHLHRDVALVRLVFLGLASLLAAAFLNPHGPALLPAALRLSSNPNLGFLEEWLPLDFSQPQGGHILYLAAMIVLFVSLFASPASLAPTGVLMVFTFGVLPLFQQRMMVWWLLVWPALVTPLWTAALDRYWPVDRRPSLMPSFRYTLVAIFLVLLTALWTVPGQWLIARRPPGVEATLSKMTPWKLAQTLENPADKSLPDYQPLARLLRSSYPRGQFTGTLFAEATLGDFLVWKLGSGAPVVAYSHAHLFPAEHWADYVTPLLGRPGWEEVLDRLGVNLIVIQPETFAVFSQKLRGNDAWLVVEPPARPGSALLVALRKRPLQP